MTEENNYFICRNEECKTETNLSGDSVNGGKVIKIGAPHKGQIFTCPHCKSKYREEDGDVLLVLEKEVIIEGKEDYAKFNNQYETNRIHFKKLVLKNINEPDYNGKILSFNKCLVDELVIENVNMVSAFYPIIFSECRIHKVHISKTKIVKASLSTYKSLWNFFGIIFYRTKITKSFLVDSCETRMAITDCEISCPLDFSKNSQVDLALIHDKNNPEIKADRGSVVRHLFEVTERETLLSEKKIKTSGKIIRGRHIDELQVDPEIKSRSLLENCSIGNLKFEEGASIKGKLIFKNCLIENIKYLPSCFEKDLVFLGCTFKNDLLMKRVCFSKSVVFEACTFEANALFNELKIEEDLYLNYSVFKKGLSVSGIRCGGYVKCEINTVQNEMNFDDNVIAKDINFSFSNAGSNMILFHNEINGYLFLTQLHINGFLDINMLNGEALTITDITVKGITGADNEKAVVEINKSNLKDNLNITRMEVEGNVNFSFTRAGGSVFLTRSSFKEDFSAISLEAGINLFMNIDFGGSCTFNSCTFNQQTYTQRNIFRGPVNWGTMKVHNIAFYDNLIDSFYIGTTEANDLKIDANKVNQEIEINNTSARDVSFKGNHSEQSFRFRYLQADDMDITDNCTQQDFAIDNSKANNLWCNNNRMEGNFSLDRSVCNDVTIENNLINENLLINNTGAHDIYINSNIAKQRIKINYNRAFDIAFNNNHAKQSIEIYESEANNLNFNNNKIEKGFSLETAEIHDKEFYKSLAGKGLVIDDSFKGFQLDKSKLNEATCKDNLVNKKFILNNSATRDIYLVRNQVEDALQLVDLTSNDLIFIGNSVPFVKFLRSLFAGIDFSGYNTAFEANIENITLKKDLRITDNLFLANIFLKKCIAGGDLHFYDNKVEKSFVLENSEIKDLKIFDNKVGEYLNILNTATNDLYAERNQVQKDILLNYATSSDLIFKENHAVAVHFSNSLFTSMSISRCKEIDQVSFNLVTTANNIKFEENVFNKNVELKLCTVGKNIEFVKNEMLHFDLLDTTANDVLLTSNLVHNTLYIHDTKADDISLKDNKVSVDGPPPAEKTASNGEQPAEQRPPGIFLNQCTIESGLGLENNDTPEVLQVSETLADSLSIFSSKTKSLQISRGRYRQAGIYHCREVGVFNCNNVTVNKDFSFVNNAFQDQFDMLYCKIENDLEFNGNVFKGFHRMRKNTVLGSLVYQSYVAEDFIVKTSFNYAILSFNKFNFVNLENTQIHSQFLFDDNTVQGQLKIGMQTLTAADTAISFPEPVSISGNKMKDALFFNLIFKSHLCLRNNNFNSDLTFHNTTHDKTLDLTGCFVGGSFIFHNTKTGDMNGNLILDNTFLDKRISFNNYSPASFSFINATFNGFEIPGDWMMRNKTLLRKKTNDETKYVLREDLMRKKKHQHADLPYNLIKSHYESYGNIIDLIDEWKHLQSTVFSDNEKVKMLSGIQRGNEILNAKPYIEQCIERTFIPVYYGFFNAKIVDALEDLSAYFAQTEFEPDEKETPEIIGLLKAFFKKYLIALRWFKNHNVFHENDRNNQRIYRQLVHNNLEEQYHVLRHIYGSNGELKEEDSAYYKWMHYKNLSDMQSAPPASKPKYWMKWLFFEKIFGWGVDLFRILWSTVGLVALFAVIYWVMFHLTPGLSIKWDEIPVQGSDIGLARSFVFALQTTFSAILGDWAPIGAGAIKIPMTINAVLGILFVTFLIGAYGRKMLR